ncbi:hypothetical protein FB45DRAFT_32176 [Roridomyces roridus]|uniref:SWIM-type domain-containing protein n=1 Tax=Roridomyces roridus TaxID=1738132 RepID=A0AAD7G1X6_9AGAR|nr:hypothetical protein FB45DRAFT_32176 [Roridomyces roridus]
MRCHVGPYALQVSWKQLELSLFYNAHALQLPEGIRDWSEYAIAAAPRESGYTWQNGEEQHARNDFLNDNAYIGTRFLLRLVQERGLVPSHVIKITHQATEVTHILALFADGRYMCDCCMGTNLGIPCRHYYVAWSKIPGLPFHISLVRARWYQDPSLEAQKIDSVSLRGQGNHSIRFSARDLPGLTIANPVSAPRILNRPNLGVTPPPPTRTIPQRSVYTALTADLRSMMNGIQTQEQLDSIHERLSGVSRSIVEENHRETIHDPPVVGRKGRPLTQRLTGVTEGRPQGGGARIPPDLSQPPQRQNRCGLCNEPGHNRTSCKQGNQGL